MKSLPAYGDGFVGWRDVRDKFSGAPLIEPDEMIHASVSYWDSHGPCVIVFRDNGQLYLIIQELQEKGRPVKWEPKPVDGVDILEMMANVRKAAEVYLSLDPKMFFDQTRDAWYLGIYLGSLSKIVSWMERQ